MYIVHSGCIVMVVPCYTQLYQLKPCIVFWIWGCQKTWTNLNLTRMLRHLWPSILKRPCVCCNRLKPQVCRQRQSCGFKPCFWATSCWKNRNIMEENDQKPGAFGSCRWGGYRSKHPTKNVPATTTGWKSTPVGLCRSAFKQRLHQVVDWCS